MHLQYHCCLEGQFQRQPCKLWTSLLTHFVHRPSAHDNLLPSLALRAAGGTPNTACIPGPPFEQSIGTFTTAFQPWDLATGDSRSGRSGYGFLRQLLHKHLTCTRSIPKLHSTLTALPATLLPNIFFWWMSSCTDWFNTPPLPASTTCCSMSEAPSLHCVALNSQQYSSSARPRMGFWSICLWWLSAGVLQVHACQVKTWTALKATQWKS